MTNTAPYDAIALFSGGLDSILAARLIQDQGLRVKCIHFTSPFFGKRSAIPHWRETYGLDIEAVDIGPEFTAMLAARPVHGFGKVINPCVDCKIIMLRKAATMMERYGANVLVSGEVLGQRPMSQRRDTLNVIRRDADVRSSLIRPLSALLMEPTPAEENGLIDRSRLLGISGRGRKDQLDLAARMGITEIPTPAGGCRLTEKENARSYWPVLRYAANLSAQDFQLANTGRQYWSFAGQEAGETPLWICVGRNQADNDWLLKLARPDDLLFKVVGFPGPISLMRPLAGRTFTGEPHADTAVLAAAAFTASFSPKAARHAQETGTTVNVKVLPGSAKETLMEMAENRSDIPLAHIIPDRVTERHWHELSWEQAREEIKAEAKERMHAGA